MCPCLCDLFADCQKAGFQKPFVLVGRTVIDTSAEVEACALAPERVNTSKDTSWEEFEKEVSALENDPWDQYMLSSALGRRL